MSARARLIVLLALASCGRDAAARDGAWSWLPGAWAPIAALPSFCEVRVAARPERDLPPLAWRACASGRAGCRQLVVDWAQGRGSVLSVDAAEPVRRLPSGQTIVELVRLYPDPRTPTFDRSMHVVYELDGPARFAYAVDERDRGGGPGSQRCFGVASAGDDGVTYRTDLAQERVSVFGRVTWDGRVSASRRVAAAELAGGAGMQASGAGAVYLATQRTGGLAVFDAASEQVVIPRDGARPALLEGARPVAGGAVVLRSAAQVALELVRPDGTTTRLVTPPAGRHVSGFAIDRSDRERLVWVEADELQPARNPVLFTAARSDDERGVVRRQVAAVPGADGGGHMVANAGHALLLASPTEATLVRLVDGRRWSVTAEPGTVFVAPMWVDDREVWLATGVALDAQGSAIDVAGVVRLSRAALGD